jgi:hypothetical protein
MMNEQRYASPFGHSAHGDSANAPEAPEESASEGSANGDIELPALPSYVGFKAQVPWEGWTDAQRRAAFNGFLHPAWYPFAALEGNFYKSPYLPEPSRVVKQKVQGVVDQEVEQRKKQFAVPMHSRSSYKPQSPVGVLKRA